jgi:hypothetical protein
LNSIMFSFLALASPSGDQRNMLFLHLEPLQRTIRNVCKVVYNKLMETSLGQRVGTYIILLWAGLMMVFVAYKLGGTAHFDYFLISLFLLFIGFKIRSRNKSASPGSRFSSVHSISEKYQQNPKQEKKYSPG